MADEADNIIRVDFGGAARIAPEPEPSEVSEAEVTAEQSDEKVRIFTDLLELGTVMVTIDARFEGVVIPADFGDEFRLNLNFCYSFQLPDFSFDERGIGASLSFSGSDRWVDVPWGAVYMLRSHSKNDVVLFPNDFPPEMVALLPPPD